MAKNAIVGQSGGPTSVINSSLAGVFQACQSRGAGTVYGMCNGIAGLLEERVVDLSKTLRSSLEIEGQNSFRDHFTEVITPLMHSIAGELFSNREDEEFFTVFFSDAVLASIVRWLTKGTPMPAEEYVARLRNLVQGLSRLDLRHGGTPEDN